MKKTLIQRIEAPSGGLSTITFSNIPQTFTDLKIFYSARSSYTNPFTAWSGFSTKVNGSSVNYSGKFVEGNGSNAESLNNPDATQWYFGAVPHPGTTANTHGNGEMYFPLYASSNPKVLAFERVTENNASNSSQSFYNGLWNDTAPITSIEMVMAGGNFVEYSTFSLYGITSGSDGITTVS